MNIRITGRRYAVSEAVEKRIQKKLGKLSKFFGEDEMCIRDSLRCPFSS